LDRYLWTVFAFQFVWSLQIKKTFYQVLSLWYSPVQVISCKALSRLFGKLFLRHPFHRIFFEENIRITGMSVCRSFNEGTWIKSTTQSGVLNLLWSILFYLHGLNLVGSRLDILTLTFISFHPKTTVILILLIMPPRRTFAWAKQTCLRFHLRIVFPSGLLQNFSFSLFNCRT